MDDLMSTKRVRKSTSMGVDFVMETQSSKPKKKTAKARSTIKSDEKHFRMKDGKFLYHFINELDSPTTLSYYTNSEQDIEVCKWLIALPSHQNPFLLPTKNSG